MIENYSQIVGTSGLLREKRRSLYDALSAAQVAGNRGLVHGLLVAVCRYADDPAVLEHELKTRGFSGPVEPYRLSD